MSIIFKPAQIKPVKTFGNCVNKALIYSPFVLLKKINQILLKSYSELGKLVVNGVIEVNGVIGVAGAIGVNGVIGVNRKIGVNGVIGIVGVIGIIEVN